MKQLRAYLKEEINVENKTGDIKEEYLTQFENKLLLKHSKSGIKNPDSMRSWALESLFFFF